MIQIQRPSEGPSVLETSEDKNRFRKPSVVRALWRMQHRKCCYCEKEIPLEGASKNVEHFRPKGKPEYSRLRNRWTNLLLACASCNGKKHEEFPLSSDGSPLLIDPSDSDMDPERKLEFIVDDNADDWGSVRARRGSRRGRETIAVVGLARTEHVRKRRKHAAEVLAAYGRILVEAGEHGDPVALQQELRSFETLMSANREFAAFVRDFAREMGFADRFGVSIPAGAEVVGIG